MKTIAIMNRKGGTGKTTTALCLADELRARGLRCLLVDMDQQHNATGMYGAEIEGVTTAYDVLTDPSADMAEAVQRTAVGEIIAGDDLMNNIESDMASAVAREARLVDALARVDAGIDYCVIDCPPALGVVALNALVAARWVVVPVGADEYSLDGLRGLLELVDLVKSTPRLNPAVELAGALFTQIDPRQRIARRKLDELRGMEGMRVFETVVRRCVRVKESQEARKPLRELDPGCTAAKDYAAWTDELLRLIRD